MSRKVLFISSVDPRDGSGCLLFDYQKAFAHEGVDADFMTLHPVEGHPEIIPVVDESKPVLRFRIRRKLMRRPVKRFLAHQKPGHSLLDRWERIPPVPTQMILSRIKEKYDLVVILFWQGMLTFSSIRAIYRKLRCPFAFICVDYSTMAGGCHYTCECQGYRTGCRNCSEAVPSRTVRFPRNNVKYRKKVYDEVRPVLFINTYMKDRYFSKSWLTRDVRMSLSPIPIDMDIFHPMDRGQARRELAIPDKYRFVMSFGCTSLSDPRKGMAILAEALKRFRDKAGSADEVLLLVTGNGYDTLKDMLPFDSVPLGFVPLDTLAKVYAASDVFLCPSVYDAGPMMVNQSLCCGTPVVAFEMGTALDCIKGRGTGVCVPSVDAASFADGIMQIYTLDESGRGAMRSRAADYAACHYSPQAIVNTMINTTYE